MHISHSYNLLLTPSASVNMISKVCDPKSGSFYGTKVILLVLLSKTIHLASKFKIVIVTGFPSGSVIFGNVHGYSVSPSSKWKTDGNNGLLKYGGSFTIYGISVISNEASHIESSLQTLFSFPAEAFMKI
jgi:hypothetical protein